MLGGNRHTYRSFRFLSCELASIPYERISICDDLVWRINLLNMRFTSEQKVHAYAQLDENERVRYERVVSA